MCVIFTDSKGLIDYVVDSGTSPSVVYGPIVASGTTSLNPTDAALAWRNFGTVLYNSNRMKESIEPLQKATTLDPKNATAWLLLGIALVNTMEFKTVGDKITPVMQPGTVEAYQHAIDLDPNGPIGQQAKDGLASLQAMGVGITTKIGEAPPKSTKKK
jgi:tetratricopeptide (TPR) repeat protein